MEPEEFEHIPWSNLVAEHRGQRVKLLYLAAAVIVAAVTGFVGIRWLSGPQHGPVTGDAASTTVADNGNHPAGTTPPLSTPASVAVATPSARPISRRQTPTPVQRSPGCEPSGS